MFGRNMVTWRSKKQNMVQKSSTQAEFRVLSSGIDEVLCIRSILQELQITCKEIIRVLCDNLSTINIAHDPVYHVQKKLDGDKFYIKEKLEEKIVNITHVNFAK